MLKKHFSNFVKKLTNFLSPVATLKKKIGGGKTIVKILGVLLLVGGIGAGIFLTQQQQDIREKAIDSCGSGFYCDHWTGKCWPVGGKTASETKRCTKTTNGKPSGQKVTDVVQKVNVCGVGNYCDYWTGLCWKIGGSKTGDTCTSTKDGKEPNVDLNNMISSITSTVDFSCIGQCYTNISDCNKVGKQPGTGKCNGTNITCCGKDISLTDTVITNNPISATNSAVSNITLTCEPGHKQCAFNTLQDCNSTGTGWTNPRTCRSGCNSEGNDCKVLVCEPEDIRCAFNTLRKCNSNGLTWDVLKDCPSGCNLDGNDCKKVLVCKPGDRQCDFDTLQDCNSTGTGWTNPKICRYGCNSDKNDCKKVLVCNPQDIRCAFNTLRKCNSTGLTWDVLKDCPSGCNLDGNDCKTPITTTENSTAGTGNQNSPSNTTAEAGVGNVINNIGNFLNGVIADVGNVITGKDDATTATAGETVIPKCYKSIDCKNGKCEGFLYFIIGGRCSNTVVPPINSFQPTINNGSTNTNGLPWVTIPGYKKLDYSSCNNPDECYSDICQNRLFPSLDRFKQCLPTIKSVQETQITSETLDVPPSNPYPESYYPTDLQGVDRIIAILTEIFKNGSGQDINSQEFKNYVYDQIKQYPDIIQYLTSTPAFKNYFSDMPVGEGSNERLIQCVQWVILMQRLINNNNNNDIERFDIKNAKDIFLLLSKTPLYRPEKTSCHTNIQTSINSTDCDDQLLVYNVGDYDGTAYRFNDYKYINKGDTFLYDNHVGLILEKYEDEDGKLYFLITEANSPNSVTGNPDGQPKTYLVSQDDFSKQVKELSKTVFIRLTPYSEENPTITDPISLP